MTGGAGGPRSGDGEVGVVVAAKVKFGLSIRLIEGRGPRGDGTMWPVPRGALPSGVTPDGSALTGLENPRSTSTSSDRGRMIITGGVCWASGSRAEKGYGVIMVARPVAGAGRDPASDLRR